MSKTPTKIEMADGSIFEWPSEMWIRAFEIKYGSAVEGTIEQFSRATARCWEGKIKPTKFGEETWEEGDFEDHAALGHEVMYSVIRAPLMGIILDERSDGKMKMVALGPDGEVTEYTAKGAKKTTIEESLGKDEDNDE